MMDSSTGNRELFDRIIRSLEVIADPAKLKQLSLIEKDLLRDRLRSLYARLSESEEREETPVEKPEVKESEDEEVISVTALDEKIQQSETETVEIRSEDLISEQPPPAGVKEKPEKEQPDLFSLGNSAGKVAEKKVIDTLENEDLKESIADKLQKGTKVDSLKNAIGINEKFFLINELFDGNLSEYNAAIENLDSQPSLEDAQRELAVLEEKYHWKEHVEAMDQLKHFLDRKFN